MTLDKALQMIRPFEGMPHYDRAVSQLWHTSPYGGKAIHEAAYRIRDAFVVYSDAVNYGMPEAA